ncbi:hypothetical protein [Pseudomonas putida]|nr:hypothetical protein [Pseudomonas putida]
MSIFNVPITSLMVIDFGSFSLNGQQVSRGSGCIRARSSGGAGQ